MTRHQSLVLLASVFGLLGAHVGAAQPAQHQPQFSGLYVGAAVGFGSRKVENENLTLGTSFSDQENAATLGGYVGYNWIVCAPYQLGIEADIPYLGGSPTARDIEFGPTGLNETTRLNSAMDWFGTLRGRAGYLLHDTFLLYATGGLAYSRIDLTLSDNCVGCGNSPFNLGPFSQSNSGNRVGWTAGGGGELLLDSNWIIRGEALFVDLGSDTNSYIVVTPIGTGNSLAKWSDEFWIGRIGIAYQFDTP
jgi:outer membrane immunogenic protein